MVGRSDELQRLERFAGSLRRGASATLVVHGEPG
jgi:hypothetical protein